MPVEVSALWPPVGLSGQRRATGRPGVRWRWRGDDSKIMPFCSLAFTFLGCRWLLEGLPCCARRLGACAPQGAAFFTLLGVWLERICTPTLLLGTPPKPGLSGWDWCNLLPEICRNPSSEDVPVSSVVVSAARDWFVPGSVNVCVVHNTQMECHHGGAVVLPLLPLGSPPVELHTFLAKRRACRCGVFCFCSGSVLVRGATCLGTHSMRGIYSAVCI